MSLLVLNEDELRQSITVTESIEAVEVAFVALAEDRVRIPGQFSLDLPHVKGHVSAKGTYLNNAPYYVIRVNSTFQDNPHINLSPKSELINVFDAATGYPVATMMDNGYLSILRAGAAGAISANYLANKKIERVAVIGSGNLAYIQLKALMAVRTFNNVSVWGRTPINVDTYARRIIEDHDLEVEIAPTVEAAVRQAEIVVTATASLHPLIRADWLKPGVHLIALGSDTPGKQELHIDVLKRADLIIVDDFEQCAAAGEIHHGLEAGVITRDSIRGELGDLVIGKIVGRTHTDQISVADLTGLGFQESAMATLALEKALFLGLGLRADTTTTLPQGWLAD